MTIFVITTLQEAYAAASASLTSGKKSSKKVEGRIFLPV
jgi:hypothetical protein